ncbi:hypothetical protein MY10362_006806 [Beauveria mimosiformis]
MGRLPGKRRSPAEKRLITWTRFYLPRDQEWPVWTVEHDDIHAGPLANVDGCSRLAVARMVDNPDHAAYVIDWYTLQDFNNFESSPACVDFLRNLPESDMAAAVEDSSSRLGHLNLDHGSASHPTSPEKSRFRLYKHSTRAATRELEGLVTLTAFSVPAKIDDNDSTFLELLSFICIWLWVLEEDSWVEEKFGTLPQPQPEGYAEPHKEEQASAADPQARESWERRAALVMPPATACVQERWDMRQVPRFWPPSSEEEGEGSE